MAEEPQLDLHRLLAVAESEPPSICETSLSGDEGTSFLETDEKEGDIEKGGNAPVHSQKNKKSSLHFFAWATVNTLATIGIVGVQSICDLFADKFQVFTNKAIFEDASLRLNQSTFAAFHFSVTGATLYAISRPSIAIFAPSRARVLDMIPLAMAMCMNVILPNLSLAFSTVAFYQIVRVLLTPLVAGINFIVYEIRIPRNAVWTLAPICVGVALVSYYDTKSAEGAHIKPTSTAGVVFAFAGVIASSLYTVWIGTYQKKFEMSSMQLLFNQAPISAFLLLYVIPFTDQPPVWSEVPIHKWKLIAMVGFSVPPNLDGSLIC
jgi:solute carrier family 35, member E3